MIVLFLPVLQDEVKYKISITLDVLSSWAFSWLASTLEFECGHGQINTSCAIIIR